MTELIDRRPDAEEIDRIHELVDEMGLYFKHLGVPRAAGQIFGYLMACDPPEQSAGEIAAAIGVSPASISSNVRLLVQLGAIEPRARRSDRKTFYRLRTDFWIEMAARKIGAFEQLETIGRRITADGGLTRTDGVEEMIAFAEFWRRELPQLTSRWKQERASSREGR
jgi:DNA-binding MarR family transcriptional regulator